MSRTKEVQDSIISSTLALTATLSTSLGPRGCDKLIIKGKDTIITNDGATILKNISYNHPVNKILSNLSQTQDKNCGDGTTSVVVLTGCLLNKCKNLLEKNVHVTKIKKAFKIIEKICNEYLDSVKIHIGDEDFNDHMFTLGFESKCVIEIEDKEYFRFRDSLLKSVITSLSSKVVCASTLEYAPVAVDSVLQANGQIEKIKVVKKIGGSIEDIKLSKGVVVSNSIKNNFDDKLSKKVKIAILQFQVSPPKTNMDSKVVVDDHLLMEKIIKEEREYLLNICKKIKKSGAELIIIQKSILRESLNELALYFLTKLNIYVIDDVERDEIQFISKALSLAESVDPDFIETKEFEIEEVKENDVTITEIKCEDACSIVVHGSDAIIIDEAERSLNDALCVVKCLYEDPYVVSGGGAMEIGVANKLMEESLKVREDNETTDFSYSYIFYEIAKAFEEVPYFLAKNAGMSSFEAISELRKFNKDKATHGINVRTHEVGNMIEENVVQPVKVSRSIFSLALETASLLLRIDDILPSKD